MDEERQIEKAKSIPLFDRPTGLIYHYTNQSGLLGILKKKQIWASHIRFLNDTKEYFAGRFFIQRIVALMKEPEQADDEITSMVGKLLVDLDSFDIYTASFSGSDRGDCLDLWRAYARTLPGYCIGFSAELLGRSLHSKATGLPQVSGLWRVHYVPELDEKYRIRQDLLWLPSLLRDAILHLKRTRVDDLINSDKPFGDLVSELNKAVDDRAKIVMMLAFLLPLIKDEGFSSEQEYRIAHVRAEYKGTEHRKGIDFHAGLSSIIPHVAIDLPEEDFAIRRIVVGPCPYPVEAAKAVQMLLESQNISGVEVVPSKIPYRNW